MSGKKIITVFGATGKQGGSVVDKFLYDPELKGEWTVRAVTRDVTKASAKALASRGAQVVSADLNDEKSLVKAMEGSTVVYAVTNYWEKLDMQLEIKQGKALADAAKEAGVELFIWSSLFNVNELTKGKLPGVFHFDSKAMVEEYVRSLGIPAAFFMPGFYMPNLPGSFRQESADKPWTLSLPVPETAPFPLFNPADTGKWIKPMVLRRGEPDMRGRRVLAATAYQTPAQIVDTFRETFPQAGRGASFYSLPHDAFKAIMTGGVGMPEFAAEEMLQNMRLMGEGGYYGGAPLDESLALLGDDKPTTLAEFLKTSKQFSHLE